MIRTAFLCCSELFVTFIQLLVKKKRKEKEEEALICFLKTDI